MVRGTLEVVNEPGTVSQPSLEQKLDYMMRTVELQNQARVLDQLLDEYKRRFVVKVGSSDSYKGVW